MPAPTSSVPTAFEFESPDYRHETSTTPRSAHDLLAELQIRIARRADEIAATQPARTALNLYCWLKAEQEVLAATFLGEVERSLRTRLQDV